MAGNVVGFPQAKRDLPTEQPFLVQYASDFAEPKQVEWIVQDLIPRGTVTLLAGAEKLGKTMLCQHLMIAAALGQPWFERETVKSRSFAIFSEDPHERILVPRRDRILAWHNADFRDLDETVSWASPTDSTPDFDPVIYRCKFRQPDGRPTELWRQTLAHCADLGVSMLFLDNASTVLEGGDAQQVSAFVRMLTQTAMRTGMAIVLLHHPDKARTAVYSGTQRWVQAIRHILVMRRPKPKRGTDEDDNVDDGRRILSLWLSNWTGERPRLFLRWDRDQGVLVAEEPPVLVSRAWRLGPAEMRDLDGRVWQAVCFCRDRGWPVASDPTSSKSLYKRSGGWMRTYGAEQIEASIERLVKDGRLVRDKEIRIPT